MSSISRRDYVSLYGPTTGDRFRLADTELIAQVEDSLLTPGEELVFGGGKSIRDGMGQTPGITNADGALDLVITSVIVMDPIIGIIKADIGIRNGRIVGIGQAGNPYVQDGVDPALIVGTGTQVIAGEGLVATAGAVDTHVHFISPEQVKDGLSSGVTTLLGGGTGPEDGARGTNTTPGAGNITRMLQATSAYPVNVGFLAKGNSSRPEVLIEEVEAGACGFKVHEDWGSTPSVMDCCLNVADDYDVQVAIHTDTINESGYLADTLAAINGRVVHAYHIEGAGGGHAPDVMAMAAMPNVLPSSTNPTRPYTTDTADNLFYMTAVTHNLNPHDPVDNAFVQSRIRTGTEAAEDVLQDLGVVSMYTSDSQAMGRMSDTITTAWRTADKMKQLTGKLAGDPDEHDNNRILRYLAKYTINPALTHGVAHLVGSLEPGKIADIVLWPTATFGVRPKLVLKGGAVARAAIGDPCGSIPTTEPVLLRPMYASEPDLARRTSMTFMSDAAVSAGVPERIGLDRWVEPVRGCRTVGKPQMVRNDAMPEIRIDPNTYDVYLDGTLATVPAVDRVAMSQLYYVV
ncbi:MULTISPECIES: urease subunit alpha [Mycobacteriaceae]|uniref:Urease subunit alpha n=2 Tax=Mycobacteriaceae TaxID=1762 RepID=F5YYV7_MYCSD|nr:MULTISPECIES: urease subunit alpha [Mycobacteriaceae]AEF34272.1 urease alpha subunit UreC [Mycolicibacter sinensis]BBX12468.1 urease subunit alpha [Mycobacterium novum]